MQQSRILEYSINLIFMKIRNFRHSNRKRQKNEVIREQAIFLAQTGYQTAVIKLASPTTPTTVYRSTLLILLFGFITLPLVQAWADTIDTVKNSAPVAQVEYTKTVDNIRGPHNTIIPAPASNTVTPTIATPAIVAIASPEATYKATCMVCHATGILKAPKLGDSAAWKKRLSGGLDALVASSIKGKNSMPARGGNPKLSDETLRATIAWMIKQ